MSRRLSQVRAGVQLESGKRDARMAELVWVREWEWVRLLWFSRLTWEMYMVVGLLQSRQGWRPEWVKKEVGRSLMEKVGSWQCDCRWDFHSVLMVWEVGLGGTHPQWGHVTREVLWVGVGTGGRVGSFPGWNNVIVEGGGGDVVHGKFIESRKEGVGNMLEEDFEFRADAWVVDVLDDGQG
jgi:hypothetical protein